MSANILRVNIKTNYNKVPKKILILNLQTFKLIKKFVRYKFAALWVILTCCSKNHCARDCFRSII